MIDDMLSMLSTYTKFLPKMKSNKIENCPLILSDLLKNLKATGNGFPLNLSLVSFLLFACLPLIQIEKVFNNSEKLLHDDR